MSIKDLNFQKKIVFSRADRVAEQIKREISSIILNKMKNPNIGFVTVTKVKLSKDLKIAKVYVSVFGKTNEKTKTIETLNEAQDFIKSQLSKKIILKYMPAVKFFLDETLDYTENISNMLNKIKIEENAKLNMELILNEEDNTKLKSINEKIINSEKILLTSHSKTDGDAIGCVLSMYNYISGLNKKVTAVIEGGCPQYLGWLPDSGLVEDNKNILLDRQFDLIICIDTNFDKRVGYPFELFEKYIYENKLVIIDHHKDTVNDSEIKIVKSNASSTGELLYHFFKINDIPLNDKIAIYLYVAIITDTWMFSQENTMSSTMAVASELLKFDTVKPYFITSKLFENKSLMQTKLLGKLIETIEFDEKNKISYGYITKKMFDETSTGDNDTEGFVNTLRSVRGSRIAVLFKEIKPGLIKANLRSKDTFDLLPIVRKFGGGGHSKAAGFTTDKPLDIIITELLTELKLNLNLNLNK
ncbi:30S ribosome-binding factor RbfA [Candidatus Dependentiae bacterium]|nr:30S ribosome-binding factor RbfA [Candidatus Dependentiae bacterium]